VRRGLFLAGVLVLLPALAGADDVLLRGGGKISGRILSRSETSVQVDVGPGIITVPMTSVLSIEVRRTLLDEYEERAATLRDDDAAGWLQLANWAAARGLNTQARRTYEKVLAIDPQHVNANRALGRVLADGRWVSEEESYQLRGLVQFEGEWMTPADRDAILGQRDARRAELARLDAERRAREAEARAADAEARARQAEAAQYGAGASLWYGAGWWPGYVWPSSPGRGKWNGKRGTRHQGATWPPIGMFPSYPIGTWPSSSPGWQPSFPIGPAGSFPIGPSPPSARSGGQRGAPPPAGKGSAGRAGPGPGRGRSR
jgi:hypothetical protein